MPRMFSGNTLLAALDAADLAALAPHLVEMTLPVGHVLCDVGETVQYSWLPRHEAVASFVVMMESGVAVEAAIIGHEGAVGGIVSHGAIPAYARATVMHAGSFYRIPVIELERAQAVSPAVAHLFARYADCLLAQVFQSVACNATHTISQRAAKWLSAAVARTGDSAFTITQDQFASLLGVGRSYASRVVQRMKAEGLLQTRRGGLTVLDARALRSQSCACDDIVREHFATVMGGLYPNAG